MSIDLKRWPFFHLLKSEFIPEIHMVMLYGDCKHKTIIVTKDKNVYILDYKEEYLKTGFFLREIKELCGKNIKTFACGLYFILALTEEGEVYIWKFDKHRFIKKWPIKSAFTQVSGFNKKRIVDIACRFHHFLVLTSDGKVNVPQMGKVLNVEASDFTSVAVGYDRTIYVWGHNFNQMFIKPLPTKFLRIFDVFAYSMHKTMCNPLIVHDSLHTVRITNNYNYKTEEVLKILESLGAAFDDSDLQEFCFQFALRHITVNTLSKDYINKLDMNTKTEIVHKELIQNHVTATSTSYSPNNNVEERNSETTTKKR
ncbi:RCC1 and BTB domain-containing protein 1 [Camponotus floridanus]|uniref:RCC1 and BTB domain-containing protein 1 n=1 Tax=Camponotus floridanus TaxID=104421 RepID=E2AGB7_CAMFO|nr:RCC1 and BTB domain-containing protein 1 [Camponotus floridanus]